ncbi:uncharacterized protein [Triticum aestivum]|nr:uncharacterized protein LOC123099581 [Triticum aestivum]
MITMSTSAAVSVAAAAAVSSAAAAVGRLLPLLPRTSSPSPPRKIYMDASSKFNLVQAARGRKVVLGAKMDSRKITKRDSPNDLKSRAQWNLELERALVEILLEHNTPYHRGGNGWSGEVWNMMVRIFHARHSYVKFSKYQLQEKEKEIKREYKMLREARKQSGVGWDEMRCMIQADAHLWDELTILFGSRINKFKSKPFPLFNLLGDLYDVHIVEGHYNFTSTSEPSQIAGVAHTETETEEVNRRFSHLLVK